MAANPSNKIKQSVKYKTHESLTLTDLTANQYHEERIKVRLGVGKFYEIGPRLNININMKLLCIFLFFTSIVFLNCRLKKM